MQKGLATSHVMISDCSEVGRQVHLGGCLVAGLGQGSTLWPEADERLRTGGNEAEGSHPSCTLPGILEVVYTKRTMCLDSRPGRVVNFIIYWSRYSGWHQLMDIITLQLLVHQRDMMSPVGSSYRRLWLKHVETMALAGLPCECIVSQSRDTKQSCLSRLELSRRLWILK